MVARAHRKPFYRLEEVCEAWGMSIWDIAAYAIEKELVVSIVAAGVLVQEGILDQAADSAPYRISNGERLLSGLIDLHGDDAWMILQRGSHRVHRFVADPGKYLEPCTSAGEPDPIEVLVQEMVVRHPERVRFEAAQELSPKAEDAASSPVLVLPPRSRGAQATHDWEACWVETCRTLYFDGVPESLTALARRQQDWFAAQGKKVPDESTLKKKLKVLWRVFAPEAERKSA
jgi:hypothetical protein